MTTPAATAMSDVLARVAPQLKAESFRKRRHNFNRGSKPGVVQVIHFQMGSHPPPGATEVAPTRVNLHGRFTINLGVYVVRLAERFGHEPRGEWVNEYDCHCRKRIGSLLPEPEDTWWELSDRDAAFETAETVLSGYGLPWLACLRDEDDIIARYHQDGRLAVGLTPAAPLAIAFLHADRDETAAAEEVLREYLKLELQPAHRSYVMNLLTDNGFSHLL